jgi:hypothetical protein
LKSCQPRKPISVFTNQAATKDRRSELHNVLWRGSKTGSMQKSAPWGVGVNRDRSSGAVGSRQPLRPPKPLRFNAATYAAAALQGTG